MWQRECLRKGSSFAALRKEEEETGEYFDYAVQQFAKILAIISNHYYQQKSTKDCKQANEANAGTNFSTTKHTTVQSNANCDSLKMTHVRIFERTTSHLCLLVQPSVSAEPCSSPAPQRSGRRTDGPLRSTVRRGNKHHELETMFRESIHDVKSEASSDDGRFMMVPDKCLIVSLCFSYPIKACREPYSQFQHEAPYGSDRSEKLFSVKIAGILNIEIKLLKIQKCQKEKRQLKIGKGFSEGSGTTF